MSIEELRAEAAQEIAGELNEYATLEFAHDAARALPALLAVVEAAEAEVKHPERHGHWYGYMPNSTTPNPCPCALCAALRHLNEKGNADADTG